VLGAPTRCRNVPDRWRGLREEDGPLGLATIAKANVSIEEGRAVFDYVAKEGVERVHAVEDPFSASRRITIASIAPRYSSSVNCAPR
jgi:hypothetical protein